MDGVIGQEQLGFGSGARSVSSLDIPSALIDWSPVMVLLAPVHASAKGEAAWPPLSMFKALLLSVWYDLSDVKLAEALDDRASFRRFCGFCGTEPVPERTAFIRFRRALIAAGQDRAVFEAVTAQLKAKAVTVKHQTKPAVHGFKAHVGADAETALVEEVSVTQADVHDGRAGFSALPHNPGDVFADSAYRGQVFAEAVRAKGGTPRIVATAMWGRDEQETLGRLKAHNRPIHQVRGRIEKIFGTWKRSYGLRRMRWRGIAKATTQVLLTAIAYNLKRTQTITATPHAQVPSDHMSNR